MNEPVPNKVLLESPLLFLPLLDVVTQIAHLTVLHNYDEDAALYEAALVSYYIGMCEVLEQVHFHHGPLLLFVGKVSEENLLSDVRLVVFLVASKEGGAKVASPNALQLFEL